MNEQDLRDWLKKVWGKDLEWVAAGYGGTVGLPDVNLLLHTRQTLPVELKFWERRQKGLRCEVRPAQIRYHRKAAREGRRSAFLIGEAYAGGIKVSTFPGRMVPVEPYPGDALRLWEVFVPGMPLELVKLEMEWLFTMDNEFWGKD